MSRKIAVIPVIIAVLALAYLPLIYYAQGARAHVSVKLERAVKISVEPPAYVILIPKSSMPPPGSSKEFFSNTGTIVIASNYAPLKVKSSAEVPKPLRGKFFMYVGGKRYDPNGWSLTKDRPGVIIYPLRFSVVVDWSLPAGDYEVNVVFTVLP